MYLRQWLISIHWLLAQIIFEDRWHISCRVLFRLVILSFGNNLGDDSFGYWWRTCYNVRDWISLCLDQYIDLVGIWVELGFLLFTLDIDQYLDVTDFIGLRQMCGYLTFDFDMWYYICFGLLEVRVPGCINWLIIWVWIVVGIVLELNYSKL